MNVHMTDRYREALKTMVEALEDERETLYKLLGPMPIHEPETHYMEAALKNLDASIGLIKGALA